jgi:MFS family permease
MGLLRAGQALPGASGRGPTPPTTFVQLHPGQTQALPGHDFLASVADAIGSYALIAALIGLLIGAVMWAFGHYSQNYQQAYNGRKGVLVSGLAAVLIGAAPFLINFFVAQGQGVR